MEDVGREIGLKLRGNLLRDWCNQLADADESVEFEDAWCSGWRAIRFCSSAIDGVLSGLRGQGDCWGLGRYVFYEIASSEDGGSLALSLVVSLAGLKRAQRARIEELAESLSFDGADLIEGSSGSIALITWPLAEGDCSGNEALDALEEVWATDVAFFERALIAWLEGHRRVLWHIPESECEEVAASDIADDLFIEGAQKTILTDKFERNREARKRCLAAHGTACAICGIDFGALYGAQFAGKIEVHHRVPLSAIREDYVVDPVKDLVPLCPNCHMVVHSKPDGGAFTIEEVRDMLERG